MIGIFYPALIMGGLGITFGALLAFASEKFFVEVDERQADIREVLPGANCGACGFPGCDAFAEAVVAEEAKVTGCVVAGSDVAEKIAAILGVEAAVEEAKVAFLMCKGSLDKTTTNCIYDGVMDCREAVVIPGKGPSACSYGCLGLGTCERVCPFDAITIQNGLAVIDEAKCVGCGICVEQCPRNVLTLIPVSSRVHVECHSPLRGPDVKKACSVGCIGCTLCVKSCPVQAITMRDALAVIDPLKCINCGICVTKCPVKCIVDMRVLPNASEKVGEATASPTA